MAASKKDVAKQQVKEDREKVREMYLSGKTVKEIAKETYFSSSYCYAMVRDLAKEKNLAKKAKRAPLNEAMIQDAKAGTTVAEIAKKHGVTYQQCYYTVSEYAQATIKKNKKKQSAATKVRNAAMLEDAKAGMTDKEIAKKYFLSRSSVRTVLAGHLHTNSKKLDERRKAILADYEAGTSSKDICEKYGISKSTLYKDIRRFTFKHRVKPLGDDDMKELCKKFLASADYPFTESELDELCHSLREQRTASAVVNACTERIVAHIVSQLPENSADAV